MGHTNDGHWQYAITADLERLYAEHVTEPHPHPFHIIEQTDGIPPELSARWDATMRKAGL